MDTNFTIKGILQNIAWVTKVEEKGFGDFIVSYSENPVYLANSIRIKKGFQIIEFSPYTIIVRYEK